MQTTYTASAGDIVSFYWKVSSEESGDYLRFKIDNVEQSGSISGEEDWQKKSFQLSAGTRTLRWIYEKDSDTTDGSDCGWVDGLYTGPSSGDLPLEPPGELSEAVDSALKFTTRGDDDCIWSVDSGYDSEYYYDGDSARSDNSLADSNESCLQAVVESDSSETLKFRWKVSSEQDSDYLEFYIDGVLQSGRISGEVDWTQKSYSISSGIHTLKWRYVKDSSGSSGDDCGWVDFVQWTGEPPVPDSDNWQQLNFKYDVAGRRSEKKVDGFSTRYVYDGAHVIAEYDGNNNLLRKYMYGPGIDQPVSMIEVADSSATYYYHYDALGSVIALSDSTGDTVQTYEYSVFGEPAVEDANHTNPFMFAGRRYDIEIGLYYNRARYYNPYTGRFLQTDPSGYSDGMNWYAYCGSNPLNCMDPTGLYADTNDSNDSNDSGASGQVVTGRYCIVPFDWSIAYVREIPNLCNFLGGGIIDLVKLNDGKRTKDEIIKAIDRQLADYEAALRHIIPLIKKATGILLPIPSPRAGWHTYIEVQDWEDLNNNNEVNDEDKFSDPYWIEVAGFGAYIDGKFKQNAMWSYMGEHSYQYITHAADAAGTAIGAAWNMGIKREGFMRVLPTEYEVRGLVYQGWGVDPYNRE